MIGGLERGVAREAEQSITPGAPSVSPSRDDGGMDLEMAMERIGRCKRYLWVQGSSLDLLMDWMHS